jgi:hypothetical protein
MASATAVDAAKRRRGEAFSVSSRWGPGASAEKKSWMGRLRLRDDQA